MRHFSITIHNNREDATHIRFVLIGYHEFDKQIILAKSDIHIYDILKNPYMSETFEFARKDRVFATADIELAFAYGSFGYGWSNQLQNPIITPGSQLMHSMFYRQEPPTERLLENASDIASALPIGHPPFIPFTVKAEIGKTAKELDIDVDVKDLTRTISDPLILVAKTRKRMGALLGHYGTLSSRTERLAFLNKLVNERSASDYQREKATMEQHKECEQTVPNSMNPLAVPHMDVDSDEDLPTMTLLMATAPACNIRGIP
ncbi:cation channel sperm-associated targeting subunit tau-like [Lineus longissimus]|uniref:cation channel sperm-associated targeting subunit tau-like n=1 Tax=Lineus longissimus TaxID=88925 RepID=UPI00315CEDEA